MSNIVLKVEIPEECCANVAQSICKGNTSLIKDSDIEFIAHQLEREFKTRFNAFHNNLWKERKINVIPETPNIIVTVEEV